MSIFQEIYYLFIRGFKQSIRPWAALLPSLFMPAFFLVIFSSAFAAITKLPGFTATSYLIFYAPVALLQAIFFSSGDAGIDMVVDITSGYFDKLMVAPIRHFSIIFGKLLAVGIRTSVQVTIVVILILLLGGKIATGFPGYLAIVALGAFFGMAWSGFGMTIALLTKNQRATQSSFILLFPFTFMTTAQLPLSLLSGWYKVAVELNPITYVLEGFRALASEGWDTTALTHSIVAITLIAVVTLGSALLSFRRFTR